MLAVAGGGTPPSVNFTIWDMEQLNWDATEELQPVFGKQIDDPNIHYLSWSPDGSRLAGAGRYAVYLWDTKDWHAAPTQFRGHKKAVECVCWSADGQKLASCGLDNSIRLVDIATKTDRSLTALHAGHVFEIAFSPDSRSIISTSGDGTVGVWDIQTGDLRARIPGHVDGVKSLLITHDKSRLITGGLWDGKMHVWQLR
jgi:WD40 repeat protein